MATSNQVNDSNTPKALIRASLEEFVTSGVEFLIIWSPPFFVQFAGVYPNRAVTDGERGSFFTQLYEDSGLYGEAVADEFLEPEARVGKAGGSRLTQLGWTAPSHSTPNWSRVVDFAGGESLDELSRAVLETFEEAFGTRGPFKFESGNLVQSAGAGRVSTRFRHRSVVKSAYPARGLRTLRSSGRCSSGDGVSAGLRPEQMRDRDLLDFRAALDDLHDAGIAKVALDRNFATAPECAVNLNRIACDAGRNA